ncbi:MAG: caspase family protein [Bacteroidota bacterium]
MKTSNILSAFSLVGMLCLTTLLYSQDTVISARSKVKHINNLGDNNKISLKSVKSMPNLIMTDPSFSDVNGNNIIDASENCTIRFTLKNDGQGQGQQVKIKVSMKNPIQGLIFSSTTNIGDIASGQSQNVTLPIAGNQNLVNGKAEFRVECIEGNGFDAEPFEMKIETHQFETPMVIVADAVFSTDQGGKIKLNYPINLKVLVQNVGKGDASKIRLEFKLLDENCLLLGDSSKFVIGKLRSGETKEFNFLFTANRRYTQNTIPVKVILAEGVGKYSRDTLVSVRLDQNLTASNQVVVKGVKTDDVKVASLSSDVDKNIPEFTEKNQNRYALIIGNEDYSSYQNNLNSEANVEFARNDARIFSEYCEKTLGVPKENITLLTDAISTKMKSEIERFAKFAQYSSGNAELIFYYAGHGFPDEQSKDSYIMPVDISGASVNDGIRLTDLYTKLTQYPTKHVCVFLDACFSGGGRNQGLLAARAVKIKPKENTVGGNLIVFSASSGDQVSLPYKDKQHGMFTYFLLKKIQESKGDISMLELTSFVKQQVEINSVKINYKDQNPVISISPEVLSSWQNWKLK